MVIVWLFSKLDTTVCLIQPTNKSTKQEEKVTNTLARLRQTTNSCLVAHGQIQQ
jgi:hypothetical protein